jgi:hypothetical protein
MKSALKVRRQLGFALAMVAAMSRMADAGQLRKIWDFNIGEDVRDGAGGSGAALGVFALSLSPDGKRIVAVVGRSEREESVLILDASAPQGNTKRLDVNPRFRDDGPTQYSRLSWSSSVSTLCLALR